MFWSTMAVEERELDKKLKAEDTDLRTVLDDMHCLQEIRNSHEPLMNFLKRDGIFKEMLTAILLPQIDPNENGGMNLKEKYRFTHQCCEAVCIGAREFYSEFENSPELINKLTNFLSANSHALNPLIVGFYSRLVISFLSAEPEKFLEILEKSEFFDGCLSRLDNCSLFELLCTIANCMPDPAFRERIKMWYVEKGFAGRLLEQLRPDRPSAIHENAAALWVEFIKALRDFQYNVEQCNDSLLESIQSEEIVLDLLNLVFPQIDPNNCDNLRYSDASVVANGVLVLNALLETNQVRNSPGWILSQEIQGVAKELMSTEQQLSLNSTDSESVGQQLLMDPKRLVESHCAERASIIIELVIDSLNSDPENFLGDQLCGCMQLLINLTNTNFLPTHFELLRAFSASSDPLRRLFDSVQLNPTRSIFNAQLITLVLHILYSNTGTQKPLIDFIIKDFNLPAVIRQVLPVDEQNEPSFVAPHNEEMESDRLFVIAKHSFFLQLANRLIQSQQTSLNAEYIERLIKELPDNEAWMDFCSNSVQSFVDQNRSEKVLSISTTNRSSNAIEIDELPDDNMFPLPNIQIEAQNLFGEFHDLKLDPMFPNANLNGSPGSFSPKGFNTSFVTKSNMNAPAPSQSSPAEQDKKNDINTVEKADKLNQIIKKNEEQRQTSPGAEEEEANNDETPKTNTTNHSAEENSSTT